MKKLLLFTALMLAGGTSYASNRTAVIQWVPPTAYDDESALDPATEILGYKVYYGTESGTYTNTLDVGANETETSIAGLSGTYYFVVTSISTELEESEYSNEITARFSKGKPKRLVIRFRPRALD
jgi:hypothetical protein